ncbi:hypothetical protein BCR44DRAFT_1447469 [Catenaria anguillulae PL171]|uniref:Uncharacterized protein n=1 Tax=Catenaria anguillulae PL171 TaxID=765915 RepID=A0A1Y2H5Q3_9FUNG|nr:hypothetical protein BCR44DRAFT_1447469 [Catenaria anguillulae PL171]
MATVGGRNAGDIFDLIHSGLAGASTVAVVWMLSKRNIYAKSRLGKLTLLVMVMLVLRHIITIRVESTSIIHAADELFINIVLKPKITNKKSLQRVRWTMHLIQQCGTVGFVGYGLFFIPTVVTPLRFCAAGYPPNNVTIFGSVWAMLATSFQGCLYIALLAQSRKLTTSQFTPLFKVTAVSGLLLALWQIYVQIDIWTQPQTADWKPILNTITFTWRVVNTVLINNYLIGLRERSKSVAATSHAGSQSQMQSQPTTGSKAARTASMRE